VEKRVSLDQKAGRRLQRVRAYLLAHKTLFAAGGTVVAGWRRYRGRRLGPYFRVAFFEDGRQRSLYLGASPELADQVRTLLDELQGPLRRKRVFQRLNRQARAALRRQKARLNEELAKWGLYLKGFEFRGWHTGPKAAGSRQQAAISGQRSARSRPVQSSCRHEVRPRSPTLTPHH